MKRLLTLFVVLGLVACGTGVANAMLSNGNLDLIGANGQLGNTPNAPWKLDATRGATLNYNDAAESTTFANVLDPGGTGLFFKAFTGNPPWDPTAGAVTAHFYQDVPGTPGMKYILDAWFGAEPNYAGLNPALPTQTLFAIDFLNGGGTVIGGTVLDLEPGLAANLGNGNPLNYSEYMIMATAPAGTATVRSRASMINGVFNQDPGQAFVTDTWTLTCTPEPASLSLLGIAVAGLAGIRRRSN